MINENDLINPFERKDEVANVKIDQFLVNLQNEIQEASNEAQTAEQLARLKQVAWSVSLWREGKNHRSFIVHARSTISL
jgi:hypothetical protein